MRMRQAVGVVVIGAGAVVLADIAMRSSLLHLLRPQIISPADGAIISGPVNVAWEGPQPMQATLTGSGLRVDLGLRESPFDIDEARFPRPGQYGIELRAPRFGTLIGVDRRFMVRRPREAAEDSVGGSPPVKRAESAPDNDALTAALVDRDRLRGEVAELQGQVTTLREDNADLNDALDELQADTDARLAAADMQSRELGREHLLALQENQLLHQRLDGIPPCTVWGYVSLPRPQTAPPSRLVVVSDRSGNVFRSEAQCVRIRLGDPTGASPCACVGAVWPGR